MRQRRCPYSQSKPQRGFTMLELLVAVLVFTFGILALVSVQATATRLATDARDRSTAAFLADQIMARMLIADPSTVATFAHRTAGGACLSSGTASSNDTVTGWLAEVTAQLPNAPASQQQVKVDAATGEVTVTLCWRNGNDNPRSLSVTNQIQWPS
jgi:type IV pilus assembly protein PilV